MKDPVKPRDKITQKMSHDGLLEQNQTTGETERISNREQENDLSKPQGQEAQETAAQLPPSSSEKSPLPHAPDIPVKRENSVTGRGMGRMGAGHTRKASQKAAKKAHREATVKTQSSRLQFTDEERSAPELEKYIKKSDKAADRLDAARAAVPKKKQLVKERTFDEATGKAKVGLRFEETDKPPGGKLKHNPLALPMQEAGAYVHGKVHQVEKDNSGVEGAHKAEKAAERLAGYGVRKVKQGYRSHKLKPYRRAAKAEQAAAKANINFQYHKALHDNPQLASTPLSRFLQKRQIKKQYAKAARAQGTKTVKTAAVKAAETAKKTAAFVSRHWKGILIAVAAQLLLILIMAGASSFSAMLSGSLSSVLGTSYVSEDRDMTGAEADYTALETALQNRIDRIEQTHSGYDEYRYDLDDIGHDPYVLTSILTAWYGGKYTRAEAQSTLSMLFERQYILTLTEEVEVRYRTETDTWTDEDGNTHTDTYTVAYNYYILHVELENFDLSHIPVYLMDEEQLSMYAAYMQTLGNRPDLFPNGTYPNASNIKPPTYYDIPPEALEDETFAAMIAEAEKHLGRPYVWGGSSPKTSFDCSGFVSWVINHSGWNVGRLGAQGIYNICTPVTLAQAKPGDLIFFKGTYDTPGVSHVGIFVGDGMMIHCGDPISYASVNTSYWQNHFYAYGRLP